MCLGKCCKSGVVGCSKSAEKRAEKNRLKKIREDEAEQKQVAELAETERKKEMLKIIIEAKKSD